MKTLNIDIIIRELTDSKTKTYQINEILKKYNLPHLVVVGAKNETNKKAN